MYLFNLISILLYLLFVKTIQHRINLIEYTCMYKLNIQICGEYLSQSNTPLRRNPVLCCLSKGSNTWVSQYYFLLKYMYSYILQHILKYKPRVLLNPEYFTFLLFIYNVHTFWFYVQNSISERISPMSESNCFKISEI